MAGKRKLLESLFEKQSEKIAKQRQNHCQKTNGFDNSSSIEQVVKEKSSQYYDDRNDMESLCYCIKKNNEFNEYSFQIRLYVMLVSLNSLNLKWMYLQSSQLIIVKHELCSFAYQICWKTDKNAWPQSIRNYFTKQSTNVKNSSLNGQWFRNGLDLSLVNIKTLDKLETKPMHNKTDHVQTKSFLTSVHDCLVEHKDFFSTILREMSDDNKYVFQRLMKALKSTEMVDLILPGKNDFKTSIMKEIKTILDEWNRNDSFSSEINPNTDIMKKDPKMLSKSVLLIMSNYFGTEEEKEFKELKESIDCLINSSSFICQDALKVFRDINHYFSQQKFFSPVKENVFFPPTPKNSAQLRNSIENTIQYKNVICTHDNIMKDEPHDILPLSKIDEHLIQFWNQEEAVNLKQLLKNDFEKERNCYCYTDVFVENKLQSRNDANKELQMKM